jgi:Leucine-rich repeat (LRR) protein
VFEGVDEDNNFSFRREIEVVDTCTFTDFNESGSVDVLDLTLLVNDLGDSVYLGNQRRNVKKSHHPFPEVINRVDLLAAVGCWNVRQQSAQGGSFHDLSLVSSGTGYAVRTLLSGNVSSIETMVVLPAGTQFDLSETMYDVLNSNFVETRYLGQIQNQIYTLNTFPSYFNNYSNLAYSNYQSITFNTHQSVSLGSLQSLAPGETFTSGVAVQVVFADGQVATLQKKFAFVHAPDTNFRNALKAQLGLSNNQAISTALAQTVTSLTLNNANISDLSGLEQFTNLTHLSLANNAIQTVPDLSGFCNLKTLDLSGNQIYRFPSLPAGLETLDISHNGLWDLPSLTYLTQLESLDVSGNRLTELSPLVSLNALETLIANDANLTSLPTLPPNLTHLEAEHNHLMALPEFTGAIVSLYVRHNFISNVSSLKNGININTTHVVLDHNMLDAKFCNARDFINKATRGNLQVFTYTNQLIPEFNCFSAISL